jgi:hypothetical protein
MHRPREPRSAEVRAMAGEWAALEEPGPHFRPSGDSVVVLPFRLHSDAMEELLDRLTPLVAPPCFDARYVRGAEPGALLTLVLLAGVHGVGVPTLPVPPRALIPPVRIPDSATPLSENVAGPRFAERLADMGWLPAEAQALSGVVRDLSRNAIEHAQAPAWVAAWQTTPGELRIAVADSGPGFAGSLGLNEEQYALREALLRGRSRFAEPGRGLGLQRVAHVVGRLGGRMRVRSRTVELAGPLPWRNSAVRMHLPYFPGVQVEVVIPTRRAGRLR